MVSVPEAARRAGRAPGTIRRWIRAGTLPATKVGARYLIDAETLTRHRGPSVMPAPAGWDRTVTGEPMPDFVAALRRQRAERTTRGQDAVACYYTENAGGSRCSRSRRRRAG